MNSYPYFEIYEPTLNLFRNWLNKSPLFQNALKTRFLKSGFNKYEFNLVRILHVAPAKLKYYLHLSANQNSKQRKKNEEQPKECVEHEC